MYLGLLPFFFASVGPWVFAEHGVQLSRLFYFYSVLIFAFLAGALWGAALFGELDKQRRHIHSAIIFSLWPLMSYFLPDTMALGLMLLGYLLLLFWEKHFTNKLYPQWYQEMRHKITFIVLACHMLAIWNIVRSSVMP